VVTPRRNQPRHVVRPKVCPIRPGQGEMHSRHTAGLEEPWRFCDEGAMKELGEGCLKRRREVMLGVHYSGILQEHSSGLPGTLGGTCRSPLAERDLAGGPGVAHSGVRSVNRDVSHVTYQSAQSGWRGALISDPPRVRARHRSREDHCRVGDLPFDPEPVASGAGSSRLPSRGKRRHRSG
jgi:hypothetical protein